MHYGITVLFYHFYIFQVSKLHVLVDEVTASYEKLFFGDVGREIYDFFWADFADWYVLPIVLGAFTSFWFPC